MGALKIRKTFYVWSASTLVVASVFLLATLLFGAPKNSNGNPKISWIPDTLNLSVPAGASNTFKVSFVATENIDNAMLWIVPELQPFVKASPAAFANIAAGQTVTTDLIVSTPVGTLPHTNSGTIHLRSASGNNKTFPNPLPVTLAVQWQSLRQDAMGVSITYPPTYIVTFSGSTNSQELAFSENQQSFDANLVPALVISTDVLTPGKTVLDWIHSFGVLDTNIVSVSIGGRSFLKWTEAGGEGDESAISYSAPLSANKSITFTVHSASLASSPALNAIISSLTITP